MLEGRLGCHAQLQAVASRKLTWLFSGPWRCGLSTRVPEASPHPQLPGGWVPRQVCGPGPARRVPSQVLLGSMEETVPDPRAPLSSSGSPERDLFVASLPWCVHSWFSISTLHLCESYSTRPRFKDILNTDMVTGAQRTLAKKAMAEKLRAEKHSAWSKEPGRTVCLGHRHAPTSC